jgi:hypothetical protein
MASPPPTDDPPEHAGFLERVRALSRTRRELILFGAALLFGLVLMPLLIWLVGNKVLGPYTHGPNLHAGPGALLEDFALGLVHGSAVFWGVALGPAVLILLLRLIVRGVRALPRARRG